MSRKIAVALSLLFTLQALPQTVTQERRVVPIGPLTRAAYYQLQPDVASNGHGFLAIWIDGRANHSAYQSAGNFLWASHFATDGTLTSAAGMKLADAVGDARIASDGNDYLIAMSRSDGIYTQPFDDQGHPLADALKVDAATTSPMTLVSNGSSYLLVTTNQSAVQWRTLDVDGRPLGDPQLISAATVWNNRAAIATNDGAYHLIYGTESCSSQPCSYGVDDIAITNGHAASPRTLVTSPVYLWYVSAASSGDQFLVAWVTADGQQLVIDDQIFDSSDNAVTAARQIAAAFQQPLTVWWDGARYLVSRAGPSYSIIGQRVGRDGQPIDATPFVVASTTAQAAFARGGGRAAVVWNDTAVPSDVYGRIVFDFNELAATTAPPLRLANAPDVRHAPATASLGDRTIRVWRAGDGNGSIEMAIDGDDAVTLSAENSENQHDPDVAAIGDLALIVWRSDTRLLRRVLGVRIDANGNRLDPKPIVIDEDVTNRTPALDRVSLATDGQSFLAAWSSQFVVAAKRIAKDGSLLDSAPVIASHSDYFICSGVKAVWNGSTYVVVFAFEDAGLTLYPLAPLNNIYAARISSSGVALDAAASRLVYHEPGAWLGDLSAAAVGGRVVIAFSEQPFLVDLIVYDLNTIDISVDGPPVPIATHFIAQVGYPFTYGIAGVAVASHGNAVLVAWSQDGPHGSEVRAQFLDRGNSFVVSEDDAYDVTVSPDASGFSFTYARTDPDALDVAQLFTRELVMTPGRLRAVR